MAPGIYKTRRYTDRDEITRDFYGYVSFFLEGIIISFILEISLWYSGIYLDIRRDEVLFKHLKILRPFIDEGTLDQNKSQITLNLDLINGCVTKDECHLTKKC